MSRRGAPILLAFGAFGVYWGAWGVLVPEIKEQTHASVSSLGVAFLFIALAALPAMLLTGFIVDRRGGRLVAPLLALFALSTLLPGLAGSVVVLSVCLAVVGACSGAVDVAIDVSGTDRGLQADSARASDADGASGAGDRSTARVRRPQVRPASAKHGSSN